MIRAIVNLKEEPYYFEISGHSGFSVSGKDTICAGISSISQTALIGLDTVLGLDVDTTIDQNRGYLKVVLPQNMTTRQKEDAFLIIATMREGIRDFQSGFPKFVKLEEN